LEAKNNIFGVLGVSQKGFLLSPPCCPRERTGLVSHEEGSLRMGSVSSRGPRNSPVTRRPEHISEPFSGEIAVVQADDDHGDGDGTGAEELGDRASGAPLILRLRTRSVRLMRPVYWASR